MTKTKYSEGMPYEPVNLPGTIGAILRVLRNKEDTEAGYLVFRHLHGATMIPAARRFTDSPMGQKLAADPDYIRRALVDLPALRTLPTGSLGWHFARHLDANGFDPAGLAKITEQAGGEALDELKEISPELFRFIDTLNWLHDLMHPLTGYDRDALGEAAILAFVHEHGAGRGNALIAFAIGMKVRSERPSWPVGKVMAHARSMAKASPDFLHADFPAFLPLPIHEVRRHLNLRPDPHYRAIPRCSRMEVMLTDDAAMPAGC